MVKRRLLTALTMWRAMIFVAGYVMVYSIFYFFLIGFSEDAQQSTSLVRFTAICSISAMLVGKAFISNIVRYPGVEGNSYVLPAYSASFGLLLLVLILGRFEYSRFLIISGFFCAIIWSFAWNMLPMQKTALKIGIIPIGDFTPLQQLNGVILSTLSSPDQSVRMLDAVAVDLRSDPGDEWERRLADYALQGLPVYHSKHLLESLTGKVELESLSENQFGTLSPISTFMASKHVADWLIALVAGVALTPVLILIAVVIRLDSSGNPIFRQTRIGYRGRPFTVFKFRTMTVAGPSDGDQRTSAMTRDRDKRVTRLGVFLRKSRIDELPQILNILRSEMSWIGPRPEAEVLSRWYEKEIPFYRYRHIVRPGITGWAQVNQGHVAEVEEVMSKSHYDFYYIKYFSPWLDMLIVARTIRTMLTGFGAR